VSGVTIDYIKLLLLLSRRPSTLAAGGRTIGCFLDFISATPPLFALRPTRWIRRWRFYWTDFPLIDALYNSPHARSSTSRTAPVREDA